MNPTRSFTDQMQRQVEVPFPPQRIISTVPSQTELLHYLGLADQVVGLTKFCEHPEQWRRQKTIIGGTKQFHFDRIEALQPDLIIGNKEENEKTQIESLAAQYPVWMSDIATLDDALEMIVSVGQLVGRTAKANQLAGAIRQAFAALAQATAQRPRARAAYLIWKNPYMVAAQGTFINHLLDLAGFDNVFAEQSRYPQVSPEALQATQAEYILLSSEPFPFSEKHVAELQALCPTSVIKLVDGALFSWYGNRLLLAAPYFLNLR